MATQQAGGVRYDESRWPFVLVTMPATELSDQEFLEHVADMAKFAQRGGRFGLVIDARREPAPNASRRRLVAEQMDRAFERDGDRCIGVAIVLNDPIKRAVLNTIQWLRRTKQPLVATPTPEEGFAWLRQAQRDQMRRAS